MIQLTTLIGGVRETNPLPDGTYIIGRGRNCHIRLDFPDVSERHAILTVRGGNAAIEDLRSANGTFVNGEEIDAPIPLDGGMVVQIGESMLRVSDGDEATEDPQDAAPMPSQEEKSVPEYSVPQYGAEPYAPAQQAQPYEMREERLAPEPIEDIPASGESSEMRDLRRSVQEQIQNELLKRLDMKRLTMQGVDTEGLEDTARAKIRQIIHEVVENGRMPEGIDPVRLEEDVFNEAMRLGPLEELLADDSVSEIMVNGPQKVYVERNGKLQLSDCQFTDDASVMSVIERIVAPLGRRIDESQPYVDARLADGSRVNAIIAPLSLSGPTITIRKFSRNALTVADFIRFGTWSHNAAEFMKLCVLLRKNIIVAGGTGSGKTTLLNLLSGFIPSTERIITVEDAAELRLQQPHVVRLEARPPNIEGKGAVPIRDLVKNCLRMRPDRIIVGECRGGEALDMLQAMNTGHDGSLTTVHANSPRDVISRLETMVLMSGMELPSRAIREQIASAVDIIIHESRLSDGSRKVVAISEVTGLEGSQIVMQDIFSFKRTGVGANGKILGEFRPTGAMPTWYDQLAGRGIQCDPKMFDPDFRGDVSIKTSRG
ncbi:MAG: FHA domain-containing protein [Lentisphaerae bacterium]|nr:FHA domain-containing protein [Lentisphaerota bacterium]